MQSSNSSNSTVIRGQLGPGFEHYYGDLDLLIKLRANGFKGAVIYDIGASNTVWSVMAHAVFPTSRIEMFEPLAEISERYREGKHTHPTVENFLNTADYKIHAIALGSKSGRRPFYRFEDESASSSIIKAKNPTIDCVSVPMHRLDDYVQVHALRPPELIKLDTQGSEMDIFLGAKKMLVAAKAILIESWLTKDYGDHTPLLLEVIDFLTDFGYFLTDFGAEYRDDRRQMHTRDALFLKSSPEILEVRINP